MSETMRDRQSIEAQLRVALVEADRCSDDADRAQGVAASLGWILGTDEIAPCSNEMAPSPTSSRVSDEAGLAEDVLYGRKQGPAVRSRSWVAGVEHGLVWALGRSPMVPIDTDEVDLRSRIEVQTELIDLRIKATNPALVGDNAKKLQGACDTLAWVLGENTAAPLSGRVAGVGPDVDAIEDEADLANLLRSPAGPAPAGVAEVDRFYAAGVDSALRWVENGSARSL